MSQTVERHTMRYPHARTSTIQYLAKREDPTKKLMKEIHEEQLRRTPRPWWMRLLKALRGVETHV